MFSAKKGKVLVPFSKGLCYDRVLELVLNLGLPTLEEAVNKVNHKQILYMT